MDTMTDEEEFDFDAEEFARVLREVGAEVAKFQASMTEAIREFGNAWNRIVTPSFREMVKREIEKNDHRPIRGCHAQRVVVDEAQSFDNSESWETEPEPVSELAEMQDALRLLTDWQLALRRDELFSMNAKQNDLLDHWADRWKLLPEGEATERTMVDYAVNRLRALIDIESRKK